MTNKNPAQILDDYLFPDALSFRSLFRYEINLSDNNPDTGGGPGNTSMSFIGYSPA